LVIVISLQPDLPCLFVQIDLGAATPEIEPLRDLLLRHVDGVVDFLLIHLRDDVETMLRRHDGLLR
jgi:hypothetical protein